MGFIVKNDRLERTEFSFFTPTQIKFGIGKVGMLASEIQIEADLAERTSVLIVADKGVVAAGLVDKVKSALADSPYEVKDVFDDVPPDSDVDTVKKVADEIADHDIDLIIAVGGGSVMDTAKLAGIIGTYGGHIRDYEGGFMVPGPCIPLIAIPTTVGTGSEVSVVAVVKDHEHTTKISIFSPHLYPRMAVLDPEMVSTLPPKLVAYTGMDALTHAIEAFTSSENQPLSDAIA
ncbi:MAG: iron-containing alcohol dehydrogenase, partial [Blastocatellia bacterium]|nr:iron-containing alcohol dehydrogenase [Blastocatellia bacterium]